MQYTLLSPGEYPHETCKITWFLLWLHSTIISLRRLSKCSFLELEDRAKERTGLQKNFKKDRGVLIIFQML